MRNQSVKLKLYIYIEKQD